MKPFLECRCEFFPVLGSVALLLAHRSSNENKFFASDVDSVNSKFTIVCRGCISTLVVHLKSY